MALLQVKENIQFSFLPSVSMEVKITKVGFLCKNGETNKKEKSYNGYISTKQEPTSIAQLVQA